MHGELLRALSKIYQDCYNNGGCNLNLYRDHLGTIGQWEGRIQDKLIFAGFSESNFYRIMDVLKEHAENLAAPTNSCSNCDGSGGVEGDLIPEDCIDCDGTGDDDCPECGGEGQEDCPRCNGTGEVNCVHCDGKGSFEGSEYEMESCHDCDGNGEIENNTFYLPDSCPKDALEMLANAAILVVKEEDEKESQ